MKKLLGLLSPFRSYLTIGALVVLVALAAFVFAQFKALERDRDELQAFATLACATAGAPFDASSSTDAKGKTVKHKRGELCQARVLELTLFERQATKVSNEALAGAIATHNSKSAADASTAARQAAAARAAAQQMEQAENAIPENDRVGRDWFDALNGLAGLRPPQR